MSRRSLIGTGIALMFMAGGLIWLLSSPALIPPAESGQARDGWDGDARDGKERREETISGEKVHRNRAFKRAMKADRVS